MVTLRVIGSPATRRTLPRLSCPGSAYRTLGRTACGEQTAEVALRSARPLHDVRPRVALEPVPACSCRALALAIPLPRVARVVKAVAVELNVYAEVGPAAVDAPAACHTVRLGQGKPGLAQQHQKGPLELAERHGCISAHDRAQLSPAACIRAPL